MLKRLKLRYAKCSHNIIILLLQVEEFGRDIYRLVKTFTQKAKQANKSRDIGGGVIQPHFHIQLVLKLLVG